MLPALHAQLSSTTRLELLAELAQSSTMAMVSSWFSCVSTCSDGVLAADLSSIALTP